MLDMLFEITTELGSVLGREWRRSFPLAEHEPSSPQVLRAILAGRVHHIGAAVMHPCETADQITIVFVVEDPWHILKQQHKFVDVNLIPFLFS